MPGMWRLDITLTNGKELYVRTPKDNWDDDITLSIGMILNNNIDQPMWSIGDRVIRKSEIVSIEIVNWSDR